MKERNDYPRIVVTTTIYNMADTLGRVYRSIKAQSYKNFYWLIIDNGSTDNITAVLDEILLEKEFEIKYVRKEHDIRATAINLAFDLAEGDLLVLIDADDELTSDALEIFAHAWGQIDAKQQNDYSMLTTLCIDYLSGSIIGKLYPKNINTERMQKKYGFLNKYERHGAINLHTVYGRRIPILEPGLSWVLEGTLWTQLQSDKKSYYINKPTRIYHQENIHNESHQFSVKKMYSGLQSYIFMLNYNYQEGQRSMPIRKVLFICCLISLYSYLSKTPLRLVLHQIHPAPYKVLVVLLSPIGYLKGHINEKRIKNME